MNYEKLTSSSGLSSASPIEGNLAALQQLFPSVVREGKVDFDALRQLLGDDVAKSDELFGLQWHGKARARRHALMPSLGTLRPCREESKNWDSTQNLYIEGDNLEVLKLLQKSYAGKVKMIYIDPPYNTGNEFVYPDDYQNGINNYLELTGQLDKFKANTETSGRYHTAWLNMMYPRLMLARELLSDDGVIFISIDDAEVAHLRKLLDEIFGENNKIGTFIWRKKEGGGQASDNFVIEHEYIIVYAKSDSLIWLDEVSERDISEYRKEDSRGYFKITKLAKWGNTARREDRPSMYFSIQAPDGSQVYPVAPDGNEGRWRVGIHRMEEIINDNLIYWEKKQDKWIAYEKEYYASQTKTIKQRSILYNLATTGDGSNQLTGLFGKKDIFENPKASQLTRLFLKSCTFTDSLILDFFSGSATTAHAVMQLNAEDGGKRRYIMVQLPEPCVEGSEAAKAGYANICEIGKERIRRAGEKVKAEAGEAGKDLDIGFRVFKLDSSNVQPWNPEAGMLNLQLESESNLRPERSSDDIFYEVLLKQGIELTEDSRSKEIAGHVVYSLGHGQYYCCFDERIGEEAQELAAGIALWHEAEDADGQNCVVYVRDSAFDAGGIWNGGTSNNSDARKTSFCLTLEQSGIMKVKGI